jgi:hypothetical protein
VTRARISLELSAISRKRRAHPSEHSALSEQSGDPGAPGSAPHAARGTVLVMVVALLGILFVVGVAFLQSVTFDARQIEADNADRQQVAAVDTLEARIFETLNAGWLAADGTPYRMAGPELVTCAADADNDGTCDDVNLDGLPNDYALNGPAYGELPYLHSTMSPLEPQLYHDSDADHARLPYAANIEKALQGAPAVVNDFFDQNTSLATQVQIPLVEDDPLQAADWAVDADGDGIADSRPFDLTTNGTPVTLPPDLRDALVKQLNDPAAAGGGVYVSVRLVPHGGMVDLNWSHPELVYAVMPELSGALSAAWDAGNRPDDAYRPEIEEAALRHRGGLPQRKLAESAVQRTFEAAVLGLQRTAPTANTAGTFDEHRWWFHRLSERGTASAEYPYWFTLMASPVLNTAAATSLDNYDRRHILTTYSTDSLLLRDGTWIAAGNAARDGRGWIEVMLEDESNSAVPGDFGGHGLDNYPDVWDATQNQYKPLAGDDPRRGRIQISLPHLEESLLSDPIVPPPPLPTPPIGIDSLQARLVGSSATAEQQKYARMFVRTLQDGFALMLQNVHASKLSVAQREFTAAALTANLIDFADTDNVPTEVEVVDTNGLSLSPRQYVFGVERQPFITEMYVKVVGIPKTPPDPPNGDPDPSKSFSVVELYNPYSVELDLSPFTLEIDDGAGVTKTIALTGQTIPPMPASGVLAANAGLKLLGLKDTPGAIPQTPLDVVWVASDQKPLQDGWTVRITRVHASTSPKTIDLEESKIAGLYDGSIGDDETKEKSVERAMWRLELPEQTVHLAYWTAVVPLTKPLGPGSGPKHTLGAANHWQGEDATVTPPQRVRPVQADVANAGSLAKAFPTTGSLLLLMRHANSEKGGSIDRPFNSYLVSTEIAGQRWKQAEYQIDNGHLPIFDIGGSARRPQSGSTEKDAKLPMGYQYLPWGQYIFDYFTALPLDWRMRKANVPDYAGNYLPEVDAAGARVYGRVNINAAPWPVLAGLPLVKPETLPKSFQDELRAFTYNGASAGAEIPLGEFTAKAIVAYRDARRIPGNPNAPNLSETGDYAKRDPVTGGVFTAEGSQDPRRHGELRKGSGFLTVGELANVRNWSVAPDPATGLSLWRTDGCGVGRLGSDGYPAEDFVQAAGLLVALGDWVTTRSNVWTIYGTLRGDAGALAQQLQTETPSLSEAAAAAIAAERVDKRAIRFEETVDRLPSFLKPGSAPQRIGERRVGAYNDTRAD